MIIKRVAIRLSVAALVAGLAGCLHIDEQSVRDEIEASRNNLKNPPTVNVTGFTPALRCMDNLMLDFGVGNISVMVEDMEDNTEAVNVGARDMFISAVSDMTQRSRAIKLVTFGNDTRNIATYVERSGIPDLYENVPIYDIRGSITQFDKDVIQKQADAGLSNSRSYYYNYDREDEGGIGASRSASGSVLGLDLAVITSNDMALLPGVTSSNAVVITRSGKAVDAEALISKWGLNFSVSVDKNEGIAQGVRSLVQLAAVELIGKLTKTPYWQCLGVEQDQLEIRRQLADWYYVLAHRGLLTQYVKEIASIRGYYRGKIDSIADADFQQMVMRLKSRYGLPYTNPRLDFAFYSAFVANKPVRSDVVTQAGAGYNLQIGTPMNADTIANGDDLVLDVRTNRDGYLSCYQLDGGSGRIKRIFPNAKTRHLGVISSQYGVRLPDNDSYTIKASRTGRLMCAISKRPVAGHIRGPSLENIAQFIHEQNGGQSGEVTIALSAD